MQRQIATRTVVALIVTVLVLAGCSDDDGSADTTTTTSSTDGGSTTTTAPTTAAELTDAPKLEDEGPSGSGCSPGAGDLPDGWWYGTFDGQAGTEVSFDLACYYVGPAAEAEAAARDDEVNNDYYVVNENPALRTVPVAEGAEASCVAADISSGMVDCALTDVDGPWAVWIRVVDGEVDRIIEQYAP